MKTGSRDNDYDELLREIERAAYGTPLGREPAEPRKTGRSWIRYLVMAPAGLVAGVLLPFVVLVRGSSFAYLHYGLGSWGAVAAGGAVTAVLLSVYVVLIGKKLTGRLRFSRRLAKVVGTVVLFYLAYAMIYISGVNVKSQEIKSYYTSLHPVLRLAVSTVVLVDRDLIITDLARERDDYARMGLPERERSFHYTQERTGFVHAADIRTLGRREWKNLLVEWYFRVMGFRTLRHVGTADHLHVELSG